MKLRGEWGEAEGTPEELAAFARALEQPGSATPVSLVPPTIVRPSAPTDALRKPPNNDALLDEYRQAPGIARHKRERHARNAGEFERVIAPKSFLDATPDDVARWERSLVSVCAHKRAVHLAGRGKVTAVPRFKCDRSLFDLTLTPPASCSVKCPVFERQLTGPRDRLLSLKNFYDWLCKKKGLTPTNPVEGVLEEHEIALGYLEGDDATAKYSPTLDEVREVLRALTIVGTPRDVLCVLCLAKTGRRPGHVLMLRGDDLLDLDGEYPLVTFKGVRARRMEENANPRTKLMGLLRSPVDSEFRDYARAVYLPWRRQTYYLADTEGPLFMNGNDGAQLTQTSLQSMILDKALDHLITTAPDDATRRKWIEHARAGSPTRISPGCFRLFFTNQTEDEGLSREDRKTFRGDKFPDALEEYRSLDARKLHAKYRMPLLLPAGVV